MQKYHLFPRDLAEHRMFSLSEPLAFSYKHHLYIDYPYKETAYPLYKSSSFHKSLYHKTTLCLMEVLVKQPSAQPALSPPQRTVWWTYCNLGGVSFIFSKLHDSFATAPGVREHVDVPPQEKHRDVCLLGLSTL